MEYFCFVDFKTGGQISEALFEIEGSFQRRNEVVAICFMKPLGEGCGRPNKDEETENNTRGPWQSFLAVISET